MKKTFFLLLALLFSIVQSRAQYTITGYSISDVVFYGSSGDSCDAAHLTVDVSGYTPGLSTTTYYFDGITVPISVIASGVAGVASCIINLPAPGVYTFKVVLYLGGVPIDSVVFSRFKLHCGFARVGSFNDLNGNCIFDAGDQLISSPMVVEISTGGVPIDTISGYNSTNYRRPGGAGTVYSYRLLQPPSGHVLTCPLSGIIYDTVGGFETEKKFGFNCVSSPGFDLGTYASVRCGVHAARASLIVKNMTCNPEDADLTIHFSPKYNFNSCAYVPTSVLPNVTTWHFPSLTAFNVKYFDAWFQKPTAVSGYAYGDTVNSRFDVTPTSGDLNPVNNIVIRVDTVRSGFDPNDISVYPSGNITAGTELEYTIHFENTGNDTAFNISVFDTLSDNVDFGTLSVVAASHNMNLVRYKSPSWPAKNIVKFDFPSINLLDSSHHGLCDGMVVFKVQSKTGLAPGTQIKNRVGIFFDYNPVVMTNTVVNTIPFPGYVTTAANEYGVSVFPNPVNDVLHIKTANTAFNTATITNAVGQLVATAQVDNARAAVNVQSLPAGIYFLYLRGEGGSSVQRFEKL